MILGTRRLMAAGVAALALTAANDAQAQRGRSGAASLPQVQCASGAPEATPFAMAAQEAVNRGVALRANARAFYTTATEQARQGVAANELNPYHHFLLGRAQMGLGNYAAADSALRRTLELCPEFGGEVRDERRTAYDRLFAEGMQAFTDGDTATALTRWEASTLVFNEGPDAYFNVGALVSARGERRRAVEMFREVIASGDRAVAAGADSAVLADLPQLRARALLNIRAAAIEAFQEDSVQWAQELLTEIAGNNPNDRLSAYVATMALFRLERWAEVVPLATRVMTLDPLTENVHLLLFNAQKNLAEAAAAQNNAALERQWRDSMVQTLTRVDSLPIMLAELGNSDTHVIGQVAKGVAPAGSTHTLEFTLYTPTGELPPARVTVTAPAEGATTRFEIPIPMAGEEPALITGMRYRLVP